MLSKFVNSLCVALLLLASTCQGAFAAALSLNRPVRFILPVASGGSADVAARTIARQLTKAWEQPVVIDNRPGAGTVVATAAVASAAPDGHTLGWVIAAHAINPSLHSNLPYDTIRDFAGVTLVYQLRIVLLASNNSPISNVDDLISSAKSRGADLLYTSSGTGTGPHLIGELFKLKQAINMTHVPYKSGPSAHADVMSGRVPIMFDTLPTALPLIMAGKLKALAVIGDTPAAALPNVPALKGVLPEHAKTGWNGVVVPAGTPKAMLGKLNADIVAALRAREVQERFSALNVEAVTTTPAQFDEFIRDEIARWAEVVKHAGIRAE